MSETTRHDSADEEAEQYRRLERQWQNEVGYELLDMPFQEPGSADVYYRQFDRIIECLDPAHPGPVIEVGCGKGHLLRRMREHTAGVRTLIGLDLSRAVQSLTTTGLDGVQGEGEHLPFRDASAAYLVFNGSLHHCIDYPGALREALRVLAPGGSLILLEPVSSRFSQAAHRILDPILRRRAVHFESPIDIRYKRDFSVDVIRSELRAQGMEIREHRSDFLAYPFTGCYAGSPFTRSLRFMRGLLAAERWVESIPWLRRLARPFSWRFIIVATKPGLPDLA